ncbi:uncharacterized protein [Typha latifolia]|uniref:uncharacterized protein n=1 Tax=Typha latifolia TaxID=4733 RepID=UPI003C2F9520
MGNCQAAEAATVVIQHPGGRVERLYWPASAGEVMRNNPGHYVALVTISIPEEARRITRVKLLKPKETLLLGQVYRLITSQEVTKAIRARKHEKMKRNEQQNSSNDQEVAREERDRNKSSSAGGSQAGVVRARQWRPSLKSISEGGS